MDMKTLTDRLREAGLIFKSLSPILPAALGSRKRIGIYRAVDTKGYYAAVFVVEKKSRFLRKDAEAIEALFDVLERHIDAKVPAKYLILAAPLCSKAKAFLEEHGWKVFVAERQNGE